jgi:aminoglycoside 2'-N-acetyltransferase I
VLSEVVADGSPDVRREAIALCRLAYGEDLTELFETAAPTVHVLVRDGDALVSHAMWCTRWLQVGDGALLRTAYVEAVATHPDYRRRGLASRVMRRLIAEIPDEFDLAALSPATIPLYERLGWRPWLGPLRERLPDGTVVATPDEEMVMIHELPGRPPVDRRQPLSVEWRVGEVW